MKKCPLCHSSNTAIHKTYSRDFIHNAYKTDPLFDNTPVDVTEDITSDIELYRCMDCDLRFYKPPVMGGSNFYSQLQAFPWYYQLVKPEFDFAKRYIISDDNILEIGCGEGYFGKMVEADYTGLDPYSQNPKVIKQSIQEHQGLYDVICGFQVLEHVDDTRSFISNALRCLKVNGILILSVPNEDGFLGNIEGWALNYPPHHVTRFTKQCLTNIANLFDLRQVEIYEEPLADFHRSLLDENRYDIKDHNINFDIGHTVIAVYKKI
jgi:SAM-dependent methyltransferase